MKKLFKGLLIIMLIIVVGVMGYNQYSHWQNKKDLAERAVSPQGQLPENVIPTHYDLSLRINPEKGTFSGAVAIKVTLTNLLNNSGFMVKTLTLALQALLPNRVKTFL